MQKHRVVLEHLHKRQHRVGVRELGLRKKRAHAELVGAPRLPFLDAGEHLVEHCAYERIGEGALHAKRQAAFHVGERFPAKCLAEQDLDARKLVAADGDGEVHLAVEDIAVFGHDNADSAKRRKAHERDLLDARLEDRRREDNREAIGKPCKGA